MSRVAVPTTMASHLPVAGIAYENPVLDFKS